MVVNACAGILHLTLSNDVVPGHTWQTALCCLCMRSVVVLPDYTASWGPRLRITSSLAVDCLHYTFALYIQMLHGNSWW